MINEELFKITKSFYDQGYKTGLQASLIILEDAIYKIHEELGKDRELSQPTGDPK